MPADQYFAVLRHVVDLLNGENTSLKELREAVAKESGIPRVDPGRSHEPSLDVLSIEEMTVEKRELILEAAFWLMDRWPSRFPEMQPESGRSPSCSQPEKGLHLKQVLTSCIGLSISVTPKAIVQQIIAGSG